MPDPFDELDRLAPGVHQSMALRDFRVRRRAAARRRWATRSVGAVALCVLVAGVAWTARADQSVEVMAGEWSAVGGEVYSEPRLIRLGFDSAGSGAWAASSARELAEMWSADEPSPFVDFDRFVVVATSTVEGVCRPFEGLVPGDPWRLEFGPESDGGCLAVARSAERVFLVERELAGEAIEVELSPGRNSEVHHLEFAQPTEDYLDWAVLGSHATPALNASEPRSLATQSELAAVWDAIGFRDLPPIVDFGQWTVTQLTEAGCVPSLVGVESVSGGVRPSFVAQSSPGTCIPTVSEWIVATPLGAGPMIVGRGLPTCRDRLVDRRAISGPGWQGRLLENASTGACEVAEVAARAELPDGVTALSSGVIDGVAPAARPIVVSPGQHLGVAFFDDPPRCPAPLELVGVARVSVELDGNLFELLPGPGGLAAREHTCGLRYALLDGAAALGASGDDLDISEPEPCVFTDDLEINHRVGVSPGVATGLGFAAIEGVECRLVSVGAIATRPDGSTNELEVRQWGNYQGLALPSMIVDERTFTVWLFNRPDPCPSGADDYVAVDLLLNGELVPLVPGKESGPWPWCGAAIAVFPGTPSDSGPADLPEGD